MYWFAVVLAVLGGVAAAIVDDFRPKTAAPHAATHKEDRPAPPERAHAADGTPIRPAETPIEVEVPREGVAAVLPLINAPREARAASTPERRPGESRRRRRVRPEAEAAVVDAAHVCPTCGAARPNVDRTLHTPAALTPQLVEDEGAAPLAAENPSAATAAPEPTATPEPTRAPEPTETPTSEPTPTPRRPLRERLTLQLATRRALEQLAERQAAPPGAPEGDSR